jgi:hypothetical protein
MQHSAGAKHEFTKKDHVLSEILKLAKGLNDENGKSKQKIVGLLAILFRVVEPIHTLYDFKIFVSSANHGLDDLQMVHLVEIAESFWMIANPVPDEGLSDAVIEDRKKRIHKIINVVGDGSCFFQAVYYWYLWLADVQNTRESVDKFVELAIRTDLEDFKMKFIMEKIFDVKAQRMWPGVIRKLNKCLNREAYMEPEFEELTFQSALEWLGFTEQKSVSQSTDKNKKAKIPGSKLIHNRHKWGESIIFQMVATALNVQLLVFTKSELQFPEFNPRYNKKAQYYGLSFASSNDSRSEEGSTNEIFQISPENALKDAEEVDRQGAWSKAFASAKEDLKEELSRCKDDDSKDKLIKRARKEADQTWKFWSKGEDYIKQNTRTQHKIHDTKFVYNGGKVMTVCMTSENHFEIITRYPRMDNTKSSQSGGSSHDGAMEIRAADTNNIGIEGERIENYIYANRLFDGGHSVVTMPCLQRCMNCRKFILN